MSALPPIRREVLVPVAPDVAFAGFTTRIGAWWPMADLSVYGDGGTVAFVDSQIVETGPAGETSVWGTVNAWQPPTTVSFSWHPGRNVQRASSVTVTFTAVDDGTLVVLEHTGWEVFEDPAKARDEYNHGWPAVLAAYGTDTSDPAVPSTWVALLHTAGPACEGSVFDAPLFAEHLAFLGRLRIRGWLVAAGPLQDQPGAGMAVVRIPGAHRIAEITRLVQDDDLSVSGGLFDVTVRPWQVMISP